MKVPVIKSRSFSSLDIARKPQDLDVDEVQFYLMAFVHGHIQGLRDSLSKKFGSTFKGLTITSSRRNSYNSGVAGAAEDSNHIYRLQDGKLRVAYDCRPIGITLDDLYNHAIATCRGEIYLNRGERIVHISPNPFEDEHWIK